MVKWILLVTENTFREAVISKFVENFNLTDLSQCRNKIIIKTHTIFLMFPNILIVNLTAFTRADWVEEFEN